ncbi:hypothetical protein EV701_108164 [Chthoniobacter flavus]|nr:hypothetical protein [Chthoniobacter flavus]TCO91436.1 hypothetical protein EV701_108164 [Chthoniobacter flavus]
MKIAAIICRTLLGLIFLVFGLNLYLHFLKMPPPQGQAGAFMGALFTSGYIYVVAAFQVVGGALLLIGRFVPIGLTLLGPVIVNILCFHAFLEPSGLPLAIVVAILFLVVFAYHRQSFAGVWKA